MVATTNSSTVIPLHRFKPNARSDNAAMRQRAIGAMVTVEQDIELLWRESLSLDDRALTERLAVVGHALRQVARLLETSGRIG